MKKLTKSMKIVLISAITAICVVGIVLGCVFGFRKQNPNNPNNPNNPTPPVIIENLSWSEKVALLGTELNQYNEMRDFGYDVIFGVPYESYTQDGNTLDTVKKNYFTIKNASGNIDFYAYSAKQDGTFNVVKVTGSKADGGLVELSNVAKSYIMDIGENIVSICSNNENSISFLYYNFVTNSVAGTMTITSENEIGFDLHLFGVSKFENYAFVEVSFEDKFQSFAINLSNGKSYAIGEYDNSENRYQIFEDFLVVSNERVQSYDVYKLNADSATKNTYELGENEQLGNAYELTNNSLLIEIAENISAESSENQKYSYKTINNGSLADYKLKTGIQRIDVQSVTFTNHFYNLRSYTRDSEITEKAVYNLKHNEIYASDGTKLFEFEATDGEEELQKIVDNKVLTTDKLFKVSENANIQVLHTIENDLSFNNQTIDNTFIESNLNFEETNNNVTLKKFDFDGNLVLNATELNISGSDEKIKIEEIEAGYKVNNGYIFAINEKYYRLNILNLNLEEISGYVIEDDIQKAIACSPNIYFTKNAETGRYAIKNSEGNIIAENITSILYDESNNESILKLTIDGKTRLLRFNALYSSFANYTSEENIDKFEEKKDYSAINEITPYDTTYYSIYLYHNYDGGGSETYYHTTSTNYYYEESYWLFGTKYRKVELKNKTGNSRNDYFPIPTRSGYTFRGYYNSSGTLMISSNGMTSGNLDSSSSSQSLYARWSTWSITTYDGYKYAYHSMSENYLKSSATLSMISGNYNVYVSWYATTEVDYDYATVSCGGTQKVKATSTTRNEQKNGNLTFSNNGYSTLSLYAYTDVSVYSSSVYFYFYKQPVVTYNANGGSFSDGSSSTESSLGNVGFSQSAKLSSGNGMPSNPTRAGYSFFGWYTSSSGGTRVDGNTTVSANTTYYAHWVEWSVSNSSSYTYAYHNLNYNNINDSKTVSMSSGYYNIYLYWAANTEANYDYGTATCGGTQRATSSSSGTTAYGSTTFSNNGYSTLTLKAYTDGSVLSSYVEMYLYKQITVTYNANGGTISGSSSINKQLANTYLTGSARLDSNSAWPSSNPTRRGYTFDGWYTTSSSTGGSYVSGSTTTTCNTTYYAHWTPIKTTVTFNANGGSGGPGSRTMTYDSSANNNLSSYIPTRSGYTFAGWGILGSSSWSHAYNKSGTWTSNSGHWSSSGTWYYPETSLTLYARWSANGVTMSLDTEYTYYSDSIYPFEAYSFTPTKSGIYKFSSSNYTGDPYGVVTTSANYTAVKNELISRGASYNGTSHIGTLSTVIAYNDDGGNVNWNFIVSVYLDAKSTYYMIATRNSTGSGNTKAQIRLSYYGANTITLDNQTANSAGTTTLYGGPKGLTVGGSSSSSGSVVAKRPEYSSSLENAHISSITIPKKTGYIFEGYFTQTKGNGIKCISSAGNILVDTMNTQFPNNGILFAKWTPITYTLVFDTNRPSDATHEPSVSPTSITATYDVDYTMPTPTLLGWTASGWSRTQNGSVDFSCGGVYRNFTTENNATVRIYAQYTRNRYYITYDSNKPAGSSASPTGTVKETEAYYDGNATISSSLYSITGWTQLGWARTADATEAAYLKGTTYSHLNFATETNASVKLYAVWRRNVYTIKIDAVGGSVIAGERVSGVTKVSESEFTLTYDTTGVFTTSIKKDGYMFAGWTISTNRGSANVVPPSGYDSFASYYDVNTDTRNAISLSTTVLNLTATDGATVTLSAKWTAITYYVTLSYATSSGSTSAQITYPTDTVITSGVTFANSTYTIPYGINAQFKISTIRHGYLFAGWDINTGVSHSCLPNNNQASKTAVMVTTTVTNLTCIHKSTVTLTEVWTPVVYTISLDANGGTISNGVVNSGLVHKSDAEYEATFDTTGVWTTSIKRDGYMFDGWTNVSNTGNTSSLPSNNASYPTYADYYDNNVNKDTSKAISIRTTTLNNSYNNGDTVILKAKWIAISYTLVYEARKPVASLYGVDSTYTPIGSTSTSTAVYGSNTTLSTNGFSLIGWTFNGWTNENSTTPKWKGGETTSTPMNLTTINGDTVTLYVAWRQNVYNIIYKLNGGSNNRENGIYPATAKFDDVFELSASLRTGYTFTRYNISSFTTDHEKYHGNTSSLGFTLSNEQTTLTINSADNHFYKNLISTDGGSVTFESVWTANKYKISYDYNDSEIGSTTKAVAGISAPTELTYDIWATISNPTRLGYTFTGWSITEMSSTCPHYYGVSTSLYSTTENTSVMVSDTSMIYFLNLHSEIGAVVKLTATWEANRYKIIYNYNDNEEGRTTVVKDSSKVVDDLTLIPPVYTVAFDSWVTIPSPQRTGYTFTGWSISGMSSTCPHDYGTGTNAGEYNTTSSTILSLSNTNISKYRNLHSEVASTDENVGIVVFKANWNPNSYKIEYIIGSTGGVLGNGTFPTSAIFDNVFYMDEPSTYPFGYHFDGWKITGASTESDCVHYFGLTNSVESSFTGSTLEQTPINTHYFKSLQANQNATVTFTAIWTPNRYNINYILTDLKGGDGHFESAQRTFADYDEQFTIADPIRTGYTFLGWSLSDLSDDCTHYYSEENTPFESTNGSYLNPQNPNEFVVLKGTTLGTTFKNLHCEIGATVTLTANWKANEYNIIYHYYPSTLNTADLINKIPNPINTFSEMTLTKSQKVTYDANFITFKMSKSVSDPAGVPVPQDVKIIGWRFYSTEQPSSNTSASLDSDDNVIIDPNAKVLNPGTEYIYSSFNIWNEYPLFGNDVHAYAIYSFVDIEVRVLYANKLVHTNYLSNYIEDTVVYHTKTFSSFTYPTSVPNLNSRTLLGFWISGSYYVEGEVNTSSVSRYKVYENQYSATSGTVAPWGYPSTQAKDPEKPIFYMYAVYEDKINSDSDSLYNVSATNDTITIDTRGLFESGHTYKITIRGFEVSSLNDYTYMYLGNSGSPVSAWGTIKPHENKETSKYTAEAVNDTTLVVTFTADASDINYYLNLYYSNFASSSAGSSSNMLLSILNDMDISINEVIQKEVIEKYDYSVDVNGNSVAVDTRGMFINGRSYKLVINSMGGVLEAEA